MKSVSYIVKGSVLLYRVFDIAQEVDLLESETLFQEGVAKGRFKFVRDPHRSLIIKDAPLVVSLGNTALKTPAGNLKATVSAKLWNYGALGIILDVELPENCNWKTLVEIGNYLDGSQEVLDTAINQKKVIVKNIFKSLKNPNTDWEDVEDYTTYLLDSVVEKTTDKDGGDVVCSPEDVIKKCAVPELINAEPKTKLSLATKKSVVNGYFQYSKEDLLVLDWNSALILDFSKEKDFRDYADIIEFSLTQALSLRRLDHELDKKLKELYQSMDDVKKKSLFSNYYENKLEEVNKTYMECAEFMEGLNNSLKVVGDYYLAIVFKIASKKFRLDDWQSSISGKMGILDKISEKIQNSQNTKKSHWLEIVIILAIIIPLFIDWGIKIWKATGN